MSVDKYEKVEGMTVGQVVDAMSQGEVFYENETPIEIDSTRCGIFLGDGKATMDLRSLRMVLNDGNIYRKIEAPWWEKHVGGLVMVRDKANGDWTVDKFKEKRGNSVFWCENSFWYEMRPLTQAEKDAIITEG